jgi:hypothetical protein
MARFFGIPLRNSLALGLGGVIALVSAPIDVFVSNLLKEDGSNLLLEDGDLILLE